MLFVLAILSPLMADDSLHFALADSVTLGAQSTTLPQASFLKVFLFTALIVGLLLTLMFIYRKLGGRQAAGTQKNIRVLSRQAVGPRQAILIVLIEDKKYAIGQTDHNLSLISDLGPASEDEIQQNDLATVKQNFAGILANLRKNS